ncbi:MAG: hypothetical protein CK426_05500 [Legionella sp.]|nr:MAG: hypothetical protein CK423_08125 [Legionella sp.]PJD98604.1 MAG: hypothetical protein CK426_05500 [Legionella sp.]
MGSNLSSKFNKWAGLTKKEEPEKDPKIVETENLINSLRINIRSCKNLRGKTLSDADLDKAINVYINNNPYDRAAGEVDKARRQIMSYMSEGKRDAVEGALSIMQKARASLKNNPSEPAQVVADTRQAIAEHKAQLVQEPSFLSKCVAYVSNIMSGKAEKAVKDLREKANADNKFLETINTAQSSTFKP